MKSYATFGLGRSLQQVRHALRSRPLAAQNMQALWAQLQQHEHRMAAQLGGPIEQLRILEIGPGQGLERARYFALRNDVVGIDLDVIPRGFDPRSYARIVRHNGWGRLAKTIGRQLLVGSANARAWSRVIGGRRGQEPRLLHGDICAEAPAQAAFDVVTSWSVFEHLPTPDQALRHVIQTLRPGGIFYISLHLYTSNNGHHDIRAFTGAEHALPPWAHLRASTQGAVQPSAYLNRWRLDQWRALFAALAPGTREYLEAYDYPSVYGPLLQGALRRELDEYSDEELLTVDAIFTWKKPARQPVDG